MNAQADILRRYIEGLGLLAQYGDADYTRKAYIAKHWDVLTKMIKRHELIMKAHKEIIS